MDGGNTYQKARFLGTAVLGQGSASKIRAIDTIEGAERVEWYRFRVRGSSSSSPLKPFVTFAGDEFARRMQVFQSVNGKPKKLIVNLDTVNNQKQRSFSTGTFFIKISGNPAPAGTGQFASFAAQIDFFN